VLNNGGKIMINNTSLDKQKAQIKEIILETVKKERPQTTSELINMIHGKTGLAKNEITSLLIELENEDKLHLTKRQTPFPTSVKEFIFSKHAAFYWITIAIATATTISVFTIPENSSVVFIRLALAFAFVLFLPGYAFMTLLFPQKLPAETSSDNMNNLERIALSIGTSLVFTVISGLILNYSPWGIRLAPMTLSLLALSVVFATAAVLHEFQSKQK
jgi:hypothetical protein